MDSRVRDHADVIATHSAPIEAGDDVIIRAPKAARPLVVALHEIAGERGANPATSWLDPRAHRAYMRAAEPDSFEVPDHILAFIEATDVYIDVKAAQNIHERGDIPPETQASYARAMQPLQEAITETRWVYTQFPAPGHAQKAEMSTAAYEDFVWGAINKDWAAQRTFQQQLVDILDDGTEVRICSGDATDIRMRIGANPIKNDDATHNLPGGEVSTAPIPHSVEGKVLFDMPVLVKGREIEDARLVFEDGEVVTHGAETNEGALTSLLETDDGARRLGELGIGMNRDIDRFTGNMLFDEKMGETIHLALGSAYEDSVKEGNERNDSAIHVDMLVDMGEASSIEVDGNTIQRDGRFVFEDGFRVE